MNRKNGYTRPIRLFILAVMMAGSMQSLSAELNWRHEPEGALAEASETTQPVLLFFTAPWCGYCKMMDNLTFKDPAVIEALGDYVVVKVDHDTYPMWVARYGVRGIPAAFLLQDGKPVARADGFYDAARFTRWLDESRDKAQGITGEESLAGLEGELREGLNDEDPAIREASLAEALRLYLGEEKTTSAVAEKNLREAHKQNPDNFVGLLGDSRLAVRILAANLYRSRFGREFTFDAWADSETRQASLDEFLKERNQAN